MTSTRRIDWAQPAIDDLLEVLVNFEEKDAGEVGKYIVARIYKSAVMLTAFPHAGRKGLVPGTRELVNPHLPYFLVYRIADEHSDVLRVMHTSKLWSGEE